MAFNDKKFATIFPTRTGTQIGSSGERLMLDALGGSEGFRTRTMTNPDGSETLLRTKNGMPQFSTSVQKSATSEYTCALEIDSGITDMIGVGEFSPYNDSPAKIYQTDYVAAHVGATDEAIGTGKLKYPKLTGNVVPNGADAKAFSPSFSGHTDYHDRKKLALKIPASLFTGRLRLYVQSLFGGTWSALVLADASNGVGRPILSVNTKARVDAGLQPALLGSGCGIYFDKENKSHFLIQPGVDSANAIPLIGSACAERYRQILQSDTSLSEEDQERIESYILSQSFPDPDFTSFLDYESTPSEALGYSWHWNWDGNKCDIIDVQEVYIPEESVYGFTTTHYRLTFSNIAFNLSVVRSIVSGPVTWSVPKHTNVIAYPEWFQRGLWKAGNSPSSVLSSARTADLYCFYQKNELKVVSVATKTISAGEQTRTSSPAHYGGTYYNYITGFLIEEEDGTTAARISNGGTSCFFSVSGATVGGYTDTSTKNTESETWLNRLTVTEATGSGYNSDILSNSTSPEAVFLVDDGVPEVSYTVDAIGRIVPGTATYPNAGVVTGVNFIAMERSFFYTFWANEYSTTTESRGSKTLLIIPFMDAEAVYLSDQLISSEDGSKTSGIKKGYSIWGETSVDVTYEGRPGYVTYGRYKPLRSTSDGSPVTFGSGVTSPFSSSITTGSKKLVTSAGVFEVPEMPEEGAFYSTAKFVSQMYTTLSSVNGVVVSEDTGVKSGSNLYPQLSSFLGWA